MSSDETKRVGEFTLVGEKENGYCADEVDEYFQQLASDYAKLRSGTTENIITSLNIRTRSFAQEKGGYRPVEVDRALDRVEDKFSDLERELRKAEMGEELWNQEIEVLANTIMGRLNRPSGERFRRPAKKLVKGYYFRDVDRLCERVKNHLQHDAKIDPNLIRKARFRSATGDMSYEESQVDAFLNRCLELMLDIR